MFLDHEKSFYNLRIVQSETDRSFEGASIEYLVVLSGPDDAKIRCDIPLLTHT